MTPPVREDLPVSARLILGLGVVCSLVLLYALLLGVLAGTVELVRLLS